MIAPDATPIAHQPVYRPIDQRPPPQPARPQQLLGPEYLAEQRRLREGERVWRMIVEVCR